MFSFAPHEISNTEPFLQLASMSLRVRSIRELPAIPQAAMLLSGDPKHRQKQTQQGECGKSCKLQRAETAHTRPYGMHFG